MPHGGNDLSLRQMEMIWEVMRTGSMTKAAHSLNVSQPAISRTVRYAEARSGLRLFVKKGTRLVITPEAEVLRQEIERVFVSVDRVQRIATSLRQGFGRPVRIISVSALAHLLLPESIAALARRQPGLKLVAKIAGETRVEESVVTGDCDFGLMGLISKPREVAGTVLCGARAVCILRADDPLAARSEIGPEELADVPLISSGRRTAAAAELDRIFREHGVDRHILVQTAESQLAVQLAAQGSGVALGDPFFLTGDLPDGLVMRPFVPEVPIQPQIVYREGRVLSRTEELLIAELRTVAAAWQDRFEAALACGPAERVTESAI